MSNYAPESTTVKKAGQVMASPLGLEWPRDREKITNKINEMRLEIRNRYPDASVFREAAYIVPVFTMKDLSGDYPGFTLPPDMASLSSVWVDKEPTVLRSRWRERHTGFISKSFERIQIIPLLNTSPTEADLTSIGARLQVRPVLACDNGKIVEIVIKTPEGLTKKLRFPLDDRQWLTSSSIATSIESVVLPDDLQGMVTLRELDGKVLSQYRRGVTVPTFQRYKIASSCSKPTVVIKGPTIFQEVFEDNEIVEIGDLAVLRHAASYLRFSENTTDTRDLRRASYDEGKMMQHVNGVMARIDGEQTQDTPVYSPIKTRVRNGLTRYRKR